MSISNKIQDIIDRRKGSGEFAGKGHVDIIRRKRVFFEALVNVLDDYCSFRSNALAQISAGSGEYYMMSVENPCFQQALETASPDEVLALAQLSLKEIGQLEKRFSRDSINISVIGRARQGKSRLLQSISGLADEVIPASNGGDCTGAKSIIANSPGATYAKVIFYDEVELIAQIQKYLDVLGISRKVGNLSQVPYLLPEIERFGSELHLKTGREQSLFGHLRKYVEYYAEYCDYVGKEIEERNIGNIRNYVAQYDVNIVPTYYFLAVKEVRIFTEFPYGYAGKIVLVDTIGLGDTSLGIRDKMIKTLRNDSDAAILVRLPSANGDGIRVEDDELYDLICEAMGQEALNRWLFFALNVCDELGNQNAGNAMAEALLRRKLNYAFVKKVNCGNQEDVEQNLLLPILQYLSENLSEVDNKMMAHANEVFGKCYLSFFSLCNKVDALSNTSFAGTLNSGGLFDELYDDNLKLAARLEELNSKYKVHDAKCPVIEDEIRKTIKTLASLCPEYDDILKELKSGKLSAHANIVYENFADHYRASISDLFEEINKSTIVGLQEGLKNDIIDILRSEDGGKLSMIPVCQEVETSGNVEWLEMFISEKLGDYPLVKDAFETILNYRLNIEGLLEYKINSCLECLDPEERQKFAKVDFSEDETKEEEAERIEQALLSSVNLLASNIIREVQDILEIPYNSFYARIRKFRERIIYSKEGERQLKNMYREYATLIWKEQFSAIAKKQSVMGELDQIQNALQEKRNKNLFTIKI